MIEEEWQIQMKTSMEIWLERVKWKLWYREWGEESLKTKMQQRGHAEVTSRVFRRQAADSKETQAEAECHKQELDRAVDVNGPVAPERD